jgi:hypothetical protein
MMMSMHPMAFFEWLIYLCQQIVLQALPAGRYRPNIQEEPVTSPRPSIDEYVRCSTPRCQKKKKLKESFPYLVASPDEVQLVSHLSWVLDPAGDSVESS